MRPKCKNELFKTILNSQFSPSDFNFSEYIDSEDGMFTNKIVFLEENVPSNFVFLIRETQNAFDSFDCCYTVHSPKMESTDWLPDSIFTDISFICLQLEEWFLQINQYLDDSKTIDLWDEYIKTNQFQGQNQQIDFNDTTDFTHDDKQQILIALQGLSISINQNFQLSKQQNKLLADSIIYLTESLDRLNKLDWKSIFIGQFFTLATALAANPHQFDALYNMFLKVIQVVHLLPMP